MSGGWQTYRCERCPLTIELGGSTWWDEAGVVYSETVQIACAACGTIHRVTEERGECRVTALSGPVREARTETLRDITGEKVEVSVWVACRSQDVAERGASPDRRGITALQSQRLFRPATWCVRAT
jgi:hypothetical protein